MDNRQRPQARGRGAQSNPPNRFQRIHAEDDLEYLEQDEDAQEAFRHIATEYFVDNAKSILSENDSPDLGFRYSLNPYRGCSHGCAYCYARPTHEYLGWNAGLDFETKVLVKERAAELFRDRLSESRWSPEPVVLSGVTDCYQPAERQFRLTRTCLEVALDARQPVSIITKNALMTRDLDILREMASLRLVSVSMSVTTLDQALAKDMEPRTSAPAARLRAIATLSDAGVPVNAMVAPVIPGLNDSEIPAILEAVHNAGAKSANYVLLRLPLTVRPVFIDWLECARPAQKSRVESLVRSTRNGELNNAAFGERMRGSGEMANQIQQTFRVFARRYGLDRKTEPLDASQFRPPKSSSGQLRLF